MLRVEGVTKSFGKLKAIDNVSFSVRAGSITGLIGPNGSGKTTMFNLISGFLRPSAGSILLDDRNVTGLRPSRIAALGLVRTFQLTSIYREMTVIEHVSMGHHLSRPGAPRHGAPQIIGNSGGVFRSAEEIIEFMGLSDVSRSPASLLPGGTQRTLSIATAIAARPKLLLLDEPLAGLTSTEKAALAAKIVQLKQLGLTILLVEHDMKSVMSTCDELRVINFGVKIGEGTPQEITSNPVVIEAYLGSHGASHA